MLDEEPERKPESGSPSHSGHSASSQASSSTHNKKTPPVRAFALTFVAVLLISGTFLTNVSLFQSALLGQYILEEHTVEIAGYAWDLRDGRVINVLIMPNPALSGWRDSYSEAARQAFRDWIMCVQIFVAEHGYSYLSEIRFAVYIAGLDGSADDDYDITVKWVDHIDSHGAAGGTVVISNSDRGITKASIVLPLTVMKGGETYFLNEADLRNIMADEIGHALGLGHSDYDKDALYGFYDFSNEVICHSSLDIYGLARIYKYLPTDDFEPPVRSAQSLVGTDILYHYMRSSM